jgi:glycosyltransferase involved in cell wall biosynthesis
MKLSIVMPVFNAEEFISGSLGTLAQQEWNDYWEVIVVDNGSTDRTCEVAQSFGSRIANLRVLRADQGRGAGYARNVGVRHAVGDALLFVDGDDEVGSGWLSAMGHALEMHEFVAARIDIEKLNSETEHAHRSAVQADGLQEYTYPHFLPHAGGGTLGIRRDLHETVGGFDETFYKLQDTDYCWRVQLTGAKLVFVPKAVLHMRLRVDPKAALKQARQWGEYNVRLYKRYRKHGMPELRLSQGLRKWWALMKQAPSAIQGQDAESWWWNLHWRLGRLLGCIRYRTLAI